MFYFINYLCYSFQCFFKKYSVFYLQVQDFIFKILVANFQEDFNCHLQVLLKKLNFFYIKSFIYFLQLFIGQNSNASNTQKLITPVKSLFHFNGTPNFLVSIPQPVLNSILNYCYLGVIDDDIGSVETILDASIKFQMPALERDCVKILASK